MALEAQNNPFTSVLMVEAADPEALPDADPSAGQQRLAVGTDHLLYLVNSSGTKTQVGGGTGLSDPMTTRGDMIYRNASNVTARLAIPAAGQVIGRSGSDLGAIYPPGYEFDYATLTTLVSPTATTEATANTVVTGNSVTYDGSTAVWVEFYSPYCYPAQANLATLSIWLYDGSSSIGFMGAQTAPAASISATAFLARKRLTPSAAAHTYSIRASTSTGTASIYGGASGAGNFPAAFIRITKA